MEMTKGQKALIKEKIEVDMEIQVNDSHVGQVSTYTMKMIGQTVHTALVLIHILMVTTRSQYLYDDSIGHVSFFPS